MTPHAGWSLRGHIIDYLATQIAYAGDGAAGRLEQALCRRLLRLIRN